MSKSYQKYEPLDLTLPKKKVVEPAVRYVKTRGGRVRAIDKQVIRWRKSLKRKGIGIGPRTGATAEEKAQEEATLSSGKKKWF